MHCERCNIEFPEGLRYCKWCGEPLVDRPRVTSELHSCPSCSAAVQPGWAFCKSCGERLRAVAREPIGAVCPRCGAVTDAGALNCLRCGEDLTGGRAAQVAQDLVDTSVIAMCSSCGERLDTGSLYCKACGSAVYTEQKPFGGSALLCGACNSYSPLGSRVCRVCGTPFAQASRTIVDRPAPSPPVQQKPATLPDLDKHLPTEEPRTKLPQQPEIESGANTLVFAGTERENQATSPAKGTVETNTLPGTAGARSEQQAPTSVMQMGRITSPVDEEVPEAEQPSGELEHEYPTHSDAGGAPAIREARTEANEPTIEFVRESQPPLPAPTTLGFGSESASSPAGAESETEAFVSRAQESPLAARQQASQDEVRTRQFVPPQPSPELQATREFQAPGAATTADHLRPADQMPSVPQRTSSEPLEPRGTGDFSPAEVGAQPMAQVTSQALPRKRAGVAIASFVVAFIVIGAAVYAAWWFLFARGRPAPPTPTVAVEQPPVTSQPPESTSPPEKPAAPVVPEGMVAVAAGTYTIGRDGADPLEQPQHKVDLPAFLIDRTEVTNAAYKKFVDATNHKPPTNWTGTTPPEGRQNFPVTGVTWQDGVDYAAWAGKRLPTEVEWEAAARGVDGRIYPWGNDWRAGTANIGLKPDDVTPDQYPPGIREVGRYPQGASPAGAVDMIGNAWEWVADEITPYSGNTEAKLTLKPDVTYRVIRGGAYDGNKVHDATYRGFLDARQAYPKVGFRCAKDAK